MATYGVFGLGKSGLATVEYLTTRGHQVFAWDDNDSTIRHCEAQPWQSPEIAMAAPRNDVTLIELKDWSWDEIEALILAPGIPLTHPKPHSVVELAHQHNKKIICDIELLWQDNKGAKFIGITGTNGKSTTTALIGHILQTNGYDVATGGNLGIPALTLGKHKYYVLELSSYQLDLIHQTKFDVAVWLNISSDHIDRHGDIHGYVKAKKNIFKNGNVTAIVGVDDEMSKGVATTLKDVTSITKDKNIGDFPLLPGLHNQQNINAAFEATKALGLSDDKIIAAIKTFPGLAHRIENVAEINGVKFINDSKATNADSTSNALAAFENIYWIIGGVPKAGGIESLQQYFPKIKKAYLIGQASDEFATTLEGKVPYVKCGTLENAVTTSYHDAHPALDAGAHEKIPHQVRDVPVLLLSPACASFDQFKNFEERGDRFKALVKQLSSISINSHPNSLSFKGANEEGVKTSNTRLREDDKGTANG